MYICQSILSFCIHPLQITYQILNLFHHVALAALESIRRAVNATQQDLAYRQHCPQAFRKDFEEPWRAVTTKVGIRNLESGNQNLRYTYIYIYIYVNMYIHIS